jgi:hypothetical protein
MDQNVIVSNCQITLQGPNQAFRTLENFHNQANRHIFKEYNKKMILVGNELLQFETFRDL